MKIRKKPIVVEAWEIDLTEMIYNGSLPTWVYRAWKEDRKIGLSSNGGDMVLRISTPEGIMTAQDKDILVRGVKDELYSIKKNIFEETYDVIDAENETDPTSKQEEVKEAIQSLGDGEITVTDFADLPDGSAICSIHMNYGTLMTFARLGLMRAIEDACDRAQELDPNA